MRSCSSRTSPTKLKSYDNNFRVLPAPPDIRKIVLKLPTSDEFQWDTMEQQVPDTFGIPDCAANKFQQKTYGHSIVNGDKPKEIISSGNTTIIGDYSIAGFDRHDHRWLVQGNGNATFQLVAQEVEKGEITVSRHYVFISLGGNQIVTLSKITLIQAIKKILAVVFQKNPTAKVFFVSILPRPIDNDTVKPAIVKANRIISQMVQKMKSIHNRIEFLSVTSMFLDEDQDPDTIWYNDDLYTLNQQGATRLRRHLFTLAGFTPNIN